METNTGSTSRWVEDSSMGTNTGATSRWVEDSSMGTNTGSTSRWVEDSSTGTNTGSTSRWVEDSSMGTNTGATSRWVEEGKLKYKLTMASSKTPHSTLCIDHTHLDGMQYCLTHIFLVDIWQENASLAVFVQVEGILPVLCLDQADIMTHERFK